MSYPRASITSSANTAVTNPAGYVIMVEPTGGYVVRMVKSWTLLPNNLPGHFRMLGEHAEVGLQETTRAKEHKPC